MFSATSVRRFFTISLACGLLISTAASPILAAPTEAFKKAETLIKQNKVTDSLPLLEKVVKDEPGNAMAYFYLGFALVVKARDEGDAARKATRIRARNAWVRAKQLGVDEPNIDSLIGSIPADGSDSPEERPITKNKEAARLMQQAEDAFTSGKLDEALVNYGKALNLDPDIYEAALFSGDVYLHKKDFPNAEIWYQKAIAIDPNRETAYRYSATPLMKQQKYGEARDRYIEAFITEPYNRFTGGGLQQWAQVTGNKLGGPDITVPVNVTFDAAGKANIAIDPKATTGAKTDGTFAWMAYGLSRNEWRKTKFKVSFPKEKTYRHSLPEEAEALRAVLKIAAEEPATKTLHPSLALLKKMDDEGLLEAYVLIIRADEGIAEDHYEYLQKHRAELRKFVGNYLIAAGP